MIRKEKEEQGLIFESLDDFDLIKREWINMPEFHQEDIGPYRQLVVSFKSDLLDKYRQQYGNSQGYVTGQLHDATRELLESLRHDRPELEKLRKTATKKEKI